MRSRSQHLSEAGKKKFLRGVKRNLRFSQIYFFSRWFILLLTRWNDASEISNSPFFCLFRGETCRQWRWDFCSHVATYSLCFKWRDAAPDWLIIKQNRLALTHAVVCVCVWPRRSDSLPEHDRRIMLTTFTTLSQLIAMWHGSRIGFILYPLLLCVTMST